MSSAQTYCYDELSNDPLHIEILRTVINWYLKMFRVALLDWTEPGNTGKDSDWKQADIQLTSLFESVSTCKMT